MKKNCLMPLILLLAGLLMGPDPACGQEGPQGAVPGNKIKIASKILNEEREIVVSLPGDYEKSRDKYPLLIVLDGDSLDYVGAITAFLARCGHIPPLIVVSVPTPSPRHHYRDFTPVKDDSLPASGGAGNFLAFLNQELIPLLESRFRCQPYRILSGQGMSGLFALYALLTGPDTFGAYLAASPSIAFANNFILTPAAAKLAQARDLDKFVFLAAGKEKVTVPAVRAFEKIVKENAGAGLQLQCLIDEDEDQGSIALSGFYHGLKALYADWRFPAGLADRGMPAIERHCRTLSRKYGYEIPLNEDFLIKRGVQLFQEQGFDDALKIFQAGSAAYPESFTMHYWLGFVYEKIKNFEKAGESYGLAFKKAEAAGSPMAGFYRQQAEKIAKKLEKK
jgi:predicted alpha/beta superfamily hydrolase